jgi:hypothetical protein
MLTKIQIPILIFSNFVNVDGSLRNLKVTNRPAPVEVDNLPHSAHCTAFPMYAPGDVLNDKVAKQVKPFGISVTDGEISFQQ